MIFVDSLFMLLVSLAMFAMAKSYRKESEGDGGNLRLLYGVKMARYVCKVLSVVALGFAVLSFAFSIFLAVRDIYGLTLDF